MFSFAYIYRFCLQNRDSTRSTVHMLRLSHRVCSFRRIRKRIFDPRFARFLGRKEREIRNWICNLGNLSPTRAICTTASQKMTCFLLFDKLCDYTVQNLVVGSSNSDDGTENKERKKRIKIENYLKNVGQFDPVP